MGFASATQLDEVYRDIKRDAATLTLTSVLVLVANDVDALCSLHILSVD